MKLKWGHVGGSESNVTGVLIKREDGTQSYAGGKIMWRDAGRRWPAVSQEERPGPHPSLTTLKTNETCQHLDLGPPSSRNIRQYVAVVGLQNFVRTDQQTRTPSLRGSTAPYNNNQRWNTLWRVTQKSLFICVEERLKKNLTCVKLILNQFMTWRPHSGIPVHHSCPSESLIPHKMLRVGDKNNDYVHVR